MESDDKFGRSQYGVYRDRAPVFRAALVAGSEENVNAIGRILSDPLDSGWFRDNLDIVLGLLDQHPALRARHKDSARRCAALYAQWGPVPALLISDISSHPLFSQREKDSMLAAAAGRSSSPHAASAGLPTLGKRR